MRARQNKTGGDIGTNQYKVQGKAKSKTRNREYQNAKLDVDYRKPEHNDVYNIKHVEVGEERKQVLIKKTEAILFGNKNQKKLDRLQRKDWNPKSIVAVQDALQNSNPGMEEFSDLRGNPFETNCYKCVSVFELRRRGYKVKTQPDRGSYIDKKLSKKPYLPWLDSKTKKVSRPSLIEINNLKKPISDIEKYIKENYLAGTSRVFTLEWCRNNGEYGHIIIVQKINGELYFIDPQIGRDAKNTLEDEFLSNEIRLDTIGINRIDDKRFDISYLDDICIDENEDYEKEKIEKLAAKNSEAFAKQLTSSKKTDEELSRKIG